MPEPITANYIAEMQGTGKHLRLCVTSTLEGDIVATVYDIEGTFSVYMSYEVTSIEQAKKKAEEAARQYLGIEQSQPVGEDSLRAASPIYLVCL
jgi:hypothetical protein